MKNMMMVAGIASVLAVCATGCGTTGVKYIAHRGESMTAPENTMPAFELAMKGADGFELDVYELKDGTLVCLHDHSPWKVTKGVCGIKVKDATFADYRNLDVGAWKGEKYKGTKIPTLAEAMALATDGKEIYVELKGGKYMLPEIRDVFKNAKNVNPGNTLFLANIEDVPAVRKEFPDYRVYVFTKAEAYWPWEKNRDPNKKDPTVAEIVARTKSCGASGVSMCYSERMTKEFVSAIQAAGISAHVWTVNDKATAEKCRQMGFDSITSDCAAELAK